MRLLRGSALLDYVLPTAIIGVAVGFGIYSLMSSGNLVGFIKGSVDMKSESTAGKFVLGPELDNSIANNADPNSSWNATPNVECADGKCDLNFGPLLVSGMPEDLNEYIQSNGTSGGTDSVMSVLDQVADMLEKQGDTAGAQEFKDLANLGHFIADIQRQKEEKADACGAINPTDPNCADLWVTSELPANLSAILTDFDSNIETLQDIGQVKHYQNDNVFDFDTLKTQNPVYAYLDLFEKIQSSDSYDSQVKNIAEECTITLNDMMTHFNAIDEALEIKGSDVASEINGLIEHNKYDLEGNVINKITLPPTAVDTENIITPETSVASDLTSVVICATGKNADSGVNCQ